jgi:hypothetical protein
MQSADEGRCATVGDAGGGAEIAVASGREDAKRRGSMDCLQHSGDQGQRLVITASVSGCRSSRSGNAIGPLACYSICHDPIGSPRFTPFVPGAPRATVGLALGAPLYIWPSASPRGPRPAGHPVTVGPPAGERAGRRGSRWSAPLDERPWPAALGLLGFAWADGDGMGRLPPQPPDNLDQVAASILEPEVPAGGNKELTPSAVLSVARRHSPH